ncbi:uncharacterized protein [Neodiprion pinetum]|uniref:uncharacterized protein n=1 Tax=Neodiprion pinetum TaxID=441929 RepID=UPI00076FB725|nr:probable phospholipid hydroperoxide glutathione peroxidase [Neodiprion pinetum]
MDGRSVLPQILPTAILVTFLSLGTTELVYTASEDSTCRRNDRDRCSANKMETFDQYTDWRNAGSMHEFTAKDIRGDDVSLSIYKGFVCIVVNVASQCGLTDSNYAQLEELYEKYRDTHKLKILAFPCDQFNGQEPGSSTDIMNFARTYNVQFDMFEKIKVNGPDAHPLWKWMKERQGGFLGNAIKWNFTKFIVDKDGQPVDRFSPTTPPNDLEATLTEYL